MAAVCAVCVLLTGAFAPPQPRAAWWCTAFSLTCETAAEQNADTDAVEFRWRLADWWQQIAG